MKRFTILTAIAILFILSAASPVEKHTSHAPQKADVMDNATFSQLVQEIFLKLPKEVLPPYALETIVRNEAKINEYLLKSGFYILITNKANFLPLIRINQNNYISYYEQNTYY